MYQKWGNGRQQKKSQKRFLGALPAAAQKYEFPELLTQDDTI